MAGGAANVAAKAAPPAPTALGARRSFRDRCARESRLRPFLLLMALYGVAMSLVEALLFLQMAREFGSSKRLMGAVTLVGTTTELAIFHRSDALVARYRGLALDSVGGFDARGFLLGPPVALRLGKPFFMLRKKGKMPNTVTGEAYAKEYAGNDALSIPRGAVSKGDKVRLEWDHNYVTRSENGGESKYPERVITLLELVS